MEDTEADRFHESFSHFHRVMTDVNNQYIMNAIYLNENFFNLWNNNTPQKMLEICLEFAVKSVINKHKEIKRGQNVTRNIPKVI
jgi:hypothetical protein